jgi:MoxR-like ATPase
MNVDAASQSCADVLDEVSSAVIADQEFLERVMLGVLARGHVLLEDVPGTGKTLTARSFATALGLSFSRVQFTPDLLPSDVTGTNVYNEAESTFEFSEGPIFANVVLADEINRAPPKTQAALLEAMEEGQVTVDGDTYQLPKPFFVIATQNPVEQEGTFVLPEAQKDRFFVKTSLGYPARDGELELINRRARRNVRTPSVQRVCTEEDLTSLRTAPEQVHVEEAVREYIVDIARATRDDPRVKTGVSPRGTQRFFEGVRSLAALRGRGFATPDDVQDLAIPLLGHRIQLSADARVNGVSSAQVIRDVLGELAVPTVSYRVADSNN